jgi:XRE family transcriptional regulator, regulator of sulfur utilization
VRLDQKILQLRKAKGITQEELAEDTRVSIRTIQRIESGESIPRPYTLKRIAEVLDVSYEELNAAELSLTDPIEIQKESQFLDVSETQYFLRLLCFSCFAYIILPYFYFLLPMFLLKRKANLNKTAKAFSKKVILTQIYWLIALPFIFLLVLFFNFIQAKYFNKAYIIHYFWPFILMYCLNVMIILRYFFQVDKIISRLEEV